MRHPWLAPLGATALLACVGADDPRGTTRAGLLCVESVSPDGRGDPRNAEGRIRQCWPGEPDCDCDRDDDCYALAGYVPCDPRAPDPAPVIRGTLRLPSDTVRGTFAPTSDGEEPEPTGSPWTYCQRYHGGVHAHAWALTVTQRVGVDLAPAGPHPQGSTVKAISLRRAKTPHADLACEDWGDNDADTYGWWPRVRRVLDPGDYLVLVDGFAGSEYALTLQTFAPPAASRCATAPPLVPGDYVAVDTALGGPGATACYPSTTRPQTFYAVTIPPWHRAVVRGSHRNYDTRFVMRAYGGCAATSCLGAARSGGEALAPVERIAALGVDNRRDTPRRVILGMSATPGATSESEAYVSLELLPVPRVEATNARCADATAVTHGTRLAAQDTRLARAPAPCDAEVFQGNVLYYRVRVPARRTLEVSATSAVEPTIAPHLRVLDGCGAPSCLASVAVGRPRSNPVTLRHTNHGDTARSYIVAVGDSFASGGGLVDLAFSILAP